MSSKIGRYLFPLLALVGWTSAAQAQSGIDAQENVFGASNVNAVVGHGRLTAGISRDGDVTVLSWPSPSYNDQLAYVSSNALDARSQPRFGALEGAGMFLGLRCDLHDGTTLVTWLRDAPWRREQDYGPEAGPHPHTRFTNEQLGLSVTIIDGIDPEVDTMVRSVSVIRDLDSSVREAWLLTYANLSPLPPESRVPELHVADWFKDGENDFAAIWHPGESAVVHFHPSDRRVFRDLLSLTTAQQVDWGSIGETLSSPTIEDADLERLLSLLPDEYGEGAWMLLSTVPKPDQHQVGFDATPHCSHLDQLIDNFRRLPEVFPGFSPPIDPSLVNQLSCKVLPEDIIAGEGWTYQARDPYTDVQDGELEGAVLAAGEVAEALRTPLVFDAFGQAQATVIIGAGATLSQALEAMEVGRDPATLLSRSQQQVDAWIDSARVPGSPGSRVHAVARRALLNLRVGTDAATGAIVASLSRQPPYALDWPRDGAFFNVMLAAAGHGSLVEKRLDLYANWQRDDIAKLTPFVDPPPPLDPDTGESVYPADAWEMNYYADGMVGGPFRFEIDTTAFAVWSLVAHVGWATDPIGHLERYWDAIERGASLLARWRDPQTGLQAPAQEDDAAIHTQTLHGAITVFGALDIAARAARLTARDALAERWEERARELRRAIEYHFFDPEEQVFFMTESGRLPVQASGLTPTGPTAWLVWPCTLLPLDDARMQNQLRRDHGIIEPLLTLEGKGGLYFMKNTISIAVAGDDFFSEIISALPKTLAEQATTGTDHFGEVMVVLEEDGVRRADQRVATPHLWEGSLFYLTALAAEDPGALTAYDLVLPASRSRNDPLQSEVKPSGGCGCESEKSSSGPAGWIAGLVVLLAAIGRVLDGRNRSGMIRTE